jgi:hypothetical protein
MTIQRGLPFAGGTATEMDQILDELDSLGARLDAQQGGTVAPAGELGGTWASPTVDAVHSGSSHASAQAAAEATAAAALAAHEADTSAAHAASAISVTPFSSIAATTVQAALEEIVSEATSGAPTTADYLVGTAQGGLSAEIVVGTSPGGELSGTWASPTVDVVHSGSSHASVQAAAEATAAAALAGHVNDTSAAHVATAIAVTPFTGITSTTVQAALEEIIAARPYVIGGFRDGLLAAGQLYVRHRPTDSFSIPTGASLSNMDSVGPAAATATFSLRKNEVEFGTAEFAAAATTATFTVASPVTITPADFFAAYAPAVPDATLSDVSMAIRGSRY